MSNKTNSELRAIFEKQLQEGKVPDVFNLMNPYNFDVNPDTDNYTDMYNEIAFNLFKMGYEVQD